MAIDSTALQYWYQLHPLHDSKQANSLSPSMSLDNRGLAYGDGFFTTMAVVNGEILWADYHWQRLDSHAKALQLTLPKNYLIAAIKKHAQHLNEGMIKVIVTRSVQELRGYGFSADGAGQECIIWLKSNAMPIPHRADIVLSKQCSLMRQSPIQAICLTSQLACLPPTLAGLKTLNRLDNVLASGELQRLKSEISGHNKKDSTLLGEGLVRDMSGTWVEGTMSNVFYQLSDSDSKSRFNHTIEAEYLTTGQWFTPPMTQSGVNGVMRQVIIDSLSKTSHPIIIRALTDKDLPQLTQLFFCNAVRGITPVTRLTLLSEEVVEFSLH